MSACLKNHLTGVAFDRERNGLIARNRSLIPRSCKPAPERSSKKTRNLKIKENVLGDLNEQPERPNPGESLKWRPWKNAEDLKVVQLPKMLKEDLKWWSNYFSSKNIEECRNGDTDQSLFASYDLTIDVCRNILLGNA